VKEDGPAGADLVLLGLAGALLASGFVSTVGLISGLLFGQGRPVAGPTDGLGILLRLPANAADPAQAWPPSDVSVLPGAFAVYATGVAVFVAVAGCAYFVGRVWLRRRSGAARGRGRLGPESTAFAGKADVADLVVAGPMSGRVILGRSHGSLIATEVEHSVLVVGATRSGKTRGYAIPALRDWDGPAIVVSAKTDLVHATHEQRSDRGSLWVFDPTEVTGLCGAGWSPLAAASDWAGAVRTANAMARVSGTTSGLGGAGKHWERVAAQVLAPLLLAASTGGLDMGDVVRWVMTKKLDEPRCFVELLGAEGEVALRSMRSYLELEPRARDSAFSTARTVLDVYEDPQVQKVCESWTIRPDRLLDGGSHTVYLQAGSSDQARLAPLFLTLLDELLGSALRLASRRRAQTGDPLLNGDGSAAPRLLLLLDEAANIAPVPDLATLASTVGGEGIQLITIFQDLSQLRHRYGSEWGSIASNHVAKVVLPGVTDPETLSYFSSTIGDEEVIGTSETAGKSGRSVSTSISRRAIVDQRALRELRTGEGLCLYGARPPIRFQLRSPG
jgi:type IV secretion system protein VirD4